MNLFPVFGVGGLRVVQSFLNKQASIYTNTFRRNLRFGAYFEAAAAVFSLVYLLFSAAGGLNAPTLLCALVCGTGFVVELLTALKAMQTAPMVLCTMTALGGSIIPPAVVSIFFFDEPMAWLQWAGVALFFLSAWMVAPKTETNAVFSFKKLLPILLVNFLVNGLLSLISKYYALRVEDGNAAIFTCLSYAVAAAVFGLILSGKKSEAPKERMPGRIFLVGGVLGATCASIVFLNTVLSGTVPVVILFTIPNAICIIGSLLLGCCLFREKVTLLRMLGAALSILSTVMVVLGGL